MRKRLIGLATGLTLFAILGMVFLNGPAAAAPGDPGTNFYAYLNGGNEVPPTTSTSTGMAMLHVNYDGSLSYTVTAYNVPNVVMGHIHLGAFGTNGPVVLNLLPMGKPGNGPSNVSVSGVATAADLSGPLKGQPLSALISQLASNAYVNIHTSDGTATRGPGNYPDGEIRGYTISGDANRVNTQPYLTTPVALATGVVPFTSAGPAQISVPQIPVVVQPVGPTNPNNTLTGSGTSNNGTTGAAGSSAGSGGSTMGAASGAATTGGSGASNTSPGTTPGFSGTGSSTGNSSGSTNIGAGSASGGIQPPTGAGTVGKPSTP